MVTIRILNPPTWAVDQFGDAFGRVFLDTPEGLAVNIAKGLDKIAEYQSVSQEAAQSVNLPATPKNEALLSNYHLNTLDREKAGIPVEVEQNGDALPLYELSVLGFRFSDGGSYEVEMYGAEWVEGLERLKLRDLDLGSFTYTTKNIRAAWGGPREVLAAPLPGHYGGFAEAAQITARDLRFWFNVFGVLRAAFESFGWSLESEHYSDGAGQFVMAYLSGEYWHTYRDKETERFVSLNFPTPQFIASFQSTFALNEVSDVSNLYNSVRINEYFYGNIDQTPISLLIEVENLEVVLPPAPPGAERPYLFFLVLYRRDQNEFVPLHIETALGTLETPTTRRLAFTFTERDVTPPRSYGFLWGYNDPETGDRLGFTLNSVDVFFRPDPSYYVTGNQIYLADLFDKTLTGMDLFTAAAHLINGKILTDQLNKTVRLLPPYDYETSTRTVTGFYQPSDVFDLLPFIDPESVSWNERNNERGRFVVLDFASATDAYIDQEGFRFDRVFDVGTGADREEQRQNPLFEPTVDVEVSAAQAGGSGPIYLPALWDNVDGNVSAAPGFRVGNFYGRIDQGETWQFEGDPEATVPYLSQRPTVELPPAVDLVPLTFRGYTTDIYNRYYRQELENLEASPEVQAEVSTGGAPLYADIDFRRPVRIPYREGSIVVQPEAAKDYQPGTRRRFLVSGKLNEA